MQTRKYIALAGSLALSIGAGRVVSSGESATPAAVGKPDPKAQAAAVQQAVKTIANPSSKAAQPGQRLAAASAKAVTPAAGTVQIPASLAATGTQPEAAAAGAQAAAPA